MNRYCTVCTKTTDHVEAVGSCHCAKCGTVKPLNITQPVLGMYVKLEPRFK